MKNNRPEIWNDIILERSLGDCSEFLRHFPEGCMGCPFNDSLKYENDTWVCDEYWSVTWDDADDSIKAKQTFNGLSI